MSGQREKERQRGQCKIICTSVVKTDNTPVCPRLILDQSSSSDASYPTDPCHYGGDPGEDRSIGIYHRI